MNSLYTTQICILVDNLKIYDEILTKIADTKKHAKII